jgi:O-antigen/teichoic acid export membrane protein
VIARLRASVTVRHGALVFAGIALSSLFNYLYYMLMGRLLGVERTGIITSLLSAMLVAGAPAVVGQLIAARIAADVEARRDAAALRKLAEVVTGWSCLLVIAVAVAGALGREALAAYFNLSSAEPVVITLVAFGLYAIVTVQRGVFQGAHRFGDLAASLSIEACSKVVVAVSLVGHLGVSGALIGVAASDALSLVYNLLAFRARFGALRAPLALDRALIVRVISHVGLGQLTITFLSFYDAPLVKHMFDARSAGLYAAATLVGRAVLSAVAFVPILILPKATARAAAGLSPLPLLLAGLTIGGAIVAGAALVGAFAPRFVVTLIAGRAFGEAAPLVLPYVAASGALALATVVAAYRMGLHRYGFVWPAFAVAVVEMIVVAQWHPTLASVVGVLAVGHTMVLVVTLIGVGAEAPLRQAQPAAPAP